MSKSLKYFPEDIMSEDEIANKFSISKQVLYKLREEGMPYLSLGKQKVYILDDVIAWLKCKKARNYPDGQNE